jgi:hypothetical protein
MNICTGKTATVCKSLRHCKCLVVISLMVMRLLVVEICDCFNLVRAWWIRVSKDKVGPIQMRHRSIIDQSIDLDSLIVPLDFYIYGTENWSSSARYFRFIPSRLINIYRNLIFHFWTFHFRFLLSSSCATESSTGMYPSIIISFMAAGARITRTSPTKPTTRR